MKEFVRGYWGPDLMDDTTGYPMALPFDHECWHRLHTLANRWFYRNPWDLQETLEEEENIDKTDGEKEIIAQEARKKEMAEQQDSEDFMRLVLNGVENTYVHE